AIVIFYLHSHAAKHAYIKGMYSTLKVPFDLAKKMLIMSMPLIINETLWAAGMATQTQIFSVRGLPVVSAFSINSTIYNVFNIVFLALGNCVGIIVGQQLGAGKVKEGKESAVRIIALSTVISIVIGALLASVSGLFPKIYNTTDQVKEIAAKLILISAIMMPVQGYLHSTYFTVRSGGKTLITFLFDSFFLWVVIIPVAWILTHKTNLDIVYIYLYVQLCDIIKCIVGTIIVKSGIWARNIAENISGENS
ncbi:MAG: MATE family efflux transporter, partial [Lachnospiraceae bacterium]|nr:MATE family efflux transporter [Lachnospiraceae bacterium]